MTTINYAIPYVTNYLANCNSGSVEYGVVGTVADELTTINIVDPDLSVKAAMQQVLGNASTEYEYTNRATGTKCIWAYLQGVEVVDEDNSWISQQPIPSLEFSRSYDKGLVATTVEGLVDVINGLEDFSKWAAVVYGFAYGRNSDAYNSYATAKGIDLGGRVVKIDPDVISLLDIEGTGNYNANVTKDTNSAYGIQANAEADLKKLTGFNPRSFRLTCIYLLRKSGLDWKAIEEQLDKKVSDNARTEVDNLLN
jgi:hypothetical protein